MSEPRDEGAMAHYRYRDDVAAYALGALDDAEARRLEQHLATCASCREYLGWLDPAVELLPESVPPREPPRRLKRDLMSAVRADVRAAERAERGAPQGWRGLLGQAWRPATAVAVCLLLVAGLVTGYALRGDDEPDSVLVEAQPAAPGVGDALAATLEVQGEAGILHVEKLPPLPGNRVYQAWIGRGERMEPSTTFVVRRDGTNEVAIDGSLAGADGVFITREPAGGSARPTLPVLMKAPLS